MHNYDVHCPELSNSPTYYTSHPSSALQLAIDLTAATGRQWVVGLCARNYFVPALPKGDDPGQSVFHEYSKYYTDEAPTEYLQLRAAWNAGYGVVSRASGYLVTKPTDSSEDRWARHGAKCAAVLSTPQPVVLKYFGGADLLSASFGVRAAQRSILPIPSAVNSDRWVIRENVRKRQLVTFTMNIRAVHRTFGLFETEIVLIFESIHSGSGAVPLHLELLPHVIVNNEVIVDGITEFAVTHCSTDVTTHPKRSHVLVSRRNSKQGKDMSSKYTKFESLLLADANIEGYDTRITDLLVESMLSSWATFGEPVRPLDPTPQRPLTWVFLETLVNPETNETRITFSHLFRDDLHVVVKFFDPIQQERSTIKIFFGMYERVRSHWRTLTPASRPDLERAAEKLVEGWIVPSL